MQYLYRAYNNQGELLYVGISNAWHERLHAHEKTSAWIEQADWVKVERYPDRESVAGAEKIAIQTESPKYNKQFSTHYTHPVNHWAAVKRWIKSGKAPDDFHAQLVKDIREGALIYEKKAAQLKPAGMAFLFLDQIDSYRYYSVDICRNCEGIVSHNMLPQLTERGEDQLLEGIGNHGAN